MNSDNFDDVIKLGNSIITEGISEDLFIEYKKMVKSLATTIKSQKEHMNEKVYPAYDKLIKSDESSYKTNLLTKIFYFKKYQYTGLKYPIFNSKIQMRMRYVIETNEVLLQINSIDK